MSPTVDTSVPPVRPGSESGPSTMGGIANAKQMSQDGFAQLLGAARDTGRGRDRSVASNKPDEVKRTQGAAGSSGSALPVPIPPPVPNPVLAADSSPIKSPANISAPGPTESATPTPEPNAGGSARAVKVQPGPSGTAVTGNTPPASPGSPGSLILRTTTTANAKASSPTTSPSPEASPNLLLAQLTSKTPTPTASSPDLAPSHGTTPQAATPGSGSPGGALSPPPTPTTGSLALGPTKGGPGSSGSQAPMPTPGHESQAASLLTLIPDAARPGSVSASGLTPAPGGPGRLEDRSTAASTAPRPADSSAWVGAAPPTGPPSLSGAPANLTGLAVPSSPLPIGSSIQGSLPIQFAGGSPSVADQMVSVLTPLQATAGGTHSVTLGLQPDGLGIVQATVTAGAQQITVSLWAATSDGHAALSQALPQLYGHLAGDPTQAVNIKLAPFGSQPPGGQWNGPGPQSFPQQSARRATDQAVDSPGPAGLGFPSGLRGRPRSTTSIDLQL